MARKKILGDSQSASGEVDLGSLASDEEIVVTDHSEKRFRKEKRAEDARDDTPTGKIIDVDPETGDEIDPDDEPVFAEGTLGSLLNQSEDDQLRSTRCNVKVIRKADTPGEVFAKPAPTRLTLEPIRNLELSIPQMDVEEMVRRTYFGGHYALQVQIGQTFGPSWDCDLADPPNVHQLMRAQEAAASVPVIDAIPVHAAPAEKPGGMFADFMEQAKALREFKEVIFGDELKELERFRSQQNTAGAAEPQSERLQMLDKALTLPAPLQEKALGYLFPADADGNKSTVAQVGEFVLDNYDRLEPVLGGVAQLFSSLLGIGGGPAQNVPPPNGGVPGVSPSSPAPQPNGELAGFFQQQPPAAPAGPSRFERKAPDADAGENMNAGASAEIAVTREEDEAMNTIEPHPATMEPAVTE